MANPNTELHPADVAVRSEGVDGVPAQLQPTATPGIAERSDRTGSVGAIGWRLFGPMRRGWVIVTLAVLAWAALAAIGLAVFGLIGAA
jgi:hypothetical protein